MNEIDRIYTSRPFYGSPRITVELNRQGYKVNHKRIERLMRIMGLQAIFPRRNLSRPDKENKIYPYLLKGLDIIRCNQVWSSDITYIPLYSGFAYMTAVIDWLSRFVLSWEISNTLDTGFCLSALERALRQGKPEIFNTDQGSQFTSNAYTAKIVSNEIRMSMDSRGRALDNIFIERLWRSLKYEDIYLKGYSSMPELIKGVDNYIKFYNFERPHQSLGYKTPAEVYKAKA